MKKLCILILTCFSITIFSQPLLFNSASVFGGVYDDRGWPILTDKCGNVYTAGTFSGTVDFDPASSVYTLTAFKADGYILKFDPVGNLLWAKQLEAEVGALITSLCLDPQENICMAATITGTVDLDPGALQYSVGTTGLTHVIYNKLDPSGNFISGFLFATGLTYGLQWPIIKYDAAGSFLVCGNFVGTVDFDPSTGNFPLSSNGSSDVFVCKFSGSGALLWAKSFGGSLGELIVGLDFDSNNNVLMTGSYNASVDFDPGPGNFLLTSLGGVDTYVLKLDVSGNFLWAVSFGAAPSNNQQDAVSAICLDSLNNVYVAGSFYDPLDFDPGAATYTLSSSGLHDGYILKLDAGGNFIWAEQLGGAGIDLVQSICIDKKNKLYALGTFSLTVDFDPSPATFNFTSAGNIDIFLLKLDESGNFIDAKQFGGTSFETAPDVWLDQTGSVYFTGSFSLTADFDPGPSVVNLVSNGGTDVFICKLSTCLDVPYSYVCAQSICSGKSASITAINNSGIIWYASNNSTTSIASGSLLITPTLSAGSYTYYAAAVSCTATDSRAGFVLTVNPLPTLSVTAQPATVCPGQAAVLSVAGASSYSWSTSQLSPTISVAISTSSVYSVTGTNTLTGCSNSKTVSVIYSTCTGLNEIWNSSFSVYPNPVSDEFHLEIEKDALITFYDQLGRKVFSQQIQKGTTTITNSYLKQGVYLLHIDFGEESYTRKIIKINTQ